MNDICDICRIDGKYARYVEKYDNVLCEDCEERFIKMWG
jgi:uncharacterized membrane protein